MWLDIINLHKKQKTSHINHTGRLTLALKPKKGPSRGKIPRHVSTRRMRTPHYPAREDAFAHTRALFPSLSAPQKKNKKKKHEPCQKSLFTL